MEMTHGFTTEGPVHISMNTRQLNDLWNVKHPYFSQVLTNGKQDSEELHCL